ncbi:MAG: hypothetical protein ACFE8G_03170 [Candidatus Hermodarchaeota archaeon]
MVVITLIYNRVFVPPDQAHMVGAKYIEWLKDNPPDKTIDKTLCIAALSADDGNIMVIGIGQVGKGKEKEALAQATRQNLFLAREINGLKYKVDIVLDFTEAYKIIGMDAPDVI